MKRNIINMKKNNQNSNSSDTIKELESNIGKLQNIIEKKSSTQLNKKFFEYEIGFSNINKRREKNEQKKYVGLSFFEMNDYYDNSDDEDNIDLLEEKQKINLEKDKVYIINYSITISIKNISSQSKYAVFLGIKNKKSDKVNIIKGSKSFFEISDEDNGKIIISNTTMHNNKHESELYVMCQLDDSCTLINKKCYLKLLKH